MTATAWAEMTDRKSDGLVSAGIVHEVVFTKEGFSPEQLTINLGDSIKFTTTRTKPFWPASNLHPNHKIYSEFDPRSPIDHLNSWTFRFDRSGNWRYHDHLLPGFSATIVVGQPQKETRNCQNISELSQAQNCWNSIMKETLANEGAPAAFLKMKSFYETDPRFALGTCHLRAHELGEAAYSLYIKNKDLNNLYLGSEAAFCNFGFYHGFLEHYIREEPTTEKVKWICDYLEKKAQANVPGIRQVCFHTAGHGFMPDPPEDVTGKNPQAILNKPLQKCWDLVGPVDEVNLIQCINGVFNVFGDWVAYRRYGLSPPEDDNNNFMWICSTQTDWLAKYGCYYELSMRIPYTKNEPLPGKINRFTANIADDKLAAVITEHLASRVILENIQTTQDTGHFLTACEKVKSSQRQPCIVGTVRGLVNYAGPGREYVKSLQTCRETLTFKDQCYKIALGNLKGYYPPEKMAEVCDSNVETKFKEYC